MSFATVRPARTFKIHGLRWVWASSKNNLLFASYLFSEDVITGQNRAFSDFENTITGQKPPISDSIDYNM